MSPRTALRAGALLLALSLVAPALPALAVDAELKKLAKDPDSFKRSDAARELGRDGSKEAAKLLVDLLEDDNPYVRDHTVAACRDLSEPAALKVIAKLLKSRDELTRRNTFEALARTKTAEALELLTPALGKEKSPWVRASTLDSLWGYRESKDVLALCTEFYGDKEPGVRAAAVECAGRIRVEGAADLTKKALGDPDDGVRAVALMQLRWVDRDAALVEIAKAAKDLSWRVRAQAVDTARELRKAEAMDVLVELLTDEVSRVASAAHRGLMALSGKEFGRDHEIWKAWWKENREGWKAPRGRLEEGSAKKGGTSAAYHGVEIDSDRICFVLDVSGSMDNDMPGIDKKKQTRWQVAREQLETTLKTVPDATRVNVVVFQESVTRAFDKPVPLTRRNRKTIATFLKRTTPKQRGDMLAGLLDALDQEGPDTLYLLSDGAPSAGRLVDKQRVRYAVRQVNRLKKRVIHCIGFGAEKKTERTFLDNVARDSGARVVYR